MRVSTAFAASALALLIGSAAAAPVSQVAAPAAQPRSEAKQSHRVVIQITQNDPAVMNMVLNNTANMMKHYEAMGEQLKVEIVAYGAGLHMMRSDTSPVRDRLAALAGNKRVTLSGCGNTMASQGRQEGKEVTLVPAARVVETGIARIVELQEQGWTYVRP